MFGLYFVGGVGAAVCLRFPWVWRVSIVFYCSCLIWIGCYIRRVVWFCLGFGFLFWMWALLRWVAGCCGLDLLYRLAGDLVCDVVGIVALV